MFPTNLSYGNGIVLAAYAGLESPLFAPTIPGYLQAWLGQEAPAGGSRPGVPAFVWGPAARARRHRAGLGNHTPIGAPWLYLLHLEEQDEIPLPPVAPEDLPPLPAAGELLYFPTHGVAGHHAAGRRAEALATSHDPSGITVVLTHAQAASPETREAYASCGMRVVDLGPPTQPVGSIAPFTLQYLLQLMRAHRRVRTDEPNAFALFAHAAGLPVDAGTGSSALPRLVETELGSRAVVPPQELRAIFDWSTHV